MAWSRGLVMTLTFPVPAWTMTFAPSGGTFALTPGARSAPTLGTGSPGRRANPETGPWKSGKHAYEIFGRAAYNGVLKVVLNR